MAVEEMKELAARKLNSLANRIENCRTFDIELEIETVSSMLLQLSQIVDVNDTLDFFESGISLLQFASTDNQQAINVPSHERNYEKIGRPSFVIPEESLEYLVHCNFKINQIAEIFQVSRRTIDRRLREYNLQIRSQYSSLTDEELSERITRIVTSFPRVGYRTVQSILKGEGIRVQEWRIRQTLRQTDPEGVLFRRLFLTTWLQSAETNI